MKKTIQPMFCQLIDSPFDSDDFLFEIKWDGERAIAFARKDRVSMKSRNQKEIGFRYPEVINEFPKALKIKSAIFDGEIVAFKKNNVSSFQKLQNRIGLNEKSEIEEKSKKIPVYYYIFDVLEIDGKNVESLSLSERRKKLEKIIKPTDHIKISEAIDAEGKTFFEAAQKKGLEGIIAKKKSSSYQEGRRGQDWQKIKITCEQEMVIGGYTSGAGSRAGTLGALLLGYYKQGKLKYAGSVGTGFNEKILKELLEKFQKIKIEKSPFDESIKLKAIFVKPKLVAQIKFHEWTSDGKLRQPVYLGLRADKKAKEVKREI
jgi:bifunctional non-homologous end joining protein LigD